MAVNASVTEDGTVVISISERFDYSVHNQFLQAYQAFPRGEKRFVVDLKDADYMDSSAMGMLLQLREHSDKAAGGVEVRNCSESIREVLQIANFHKLFKIR
jgi:anti-anti-sigma factor